MIRKHPIVFGIVLFFVLGIVAIVIRANMPKPTQVRAAKAEREEAITSLVSASGQIRAHEMVDIQTEVAGVIVDLPVKEGQHVKKGDVLLRIDPFQAGTELAGARARYIASGAELKRADMMIATAQANLARQRDTINGLEADLQQSEIMHQRDVNAMKRQEPLLKTKAISPEEFEVAQTKAQASAKAVEGARSRLAQAQSDLRTSKLAIEQQKSAKEVSQQDLASSKAVLDRAQDQLNKVTITAPLDGIIVALNVEIGERAVPGIQSNPQATLMTIAKMSTIEAEIQADESDIIRVENGQTAKVDVDALPDDHLKGHVTEIGTMPIATTGSNQEGKDFKVVIGIDNPPKTLRVGMSCEAEITVDSHKNVLAIPIQALTMRDVTVDAKENYVAPPKPKKGSTGGPGTPANADDGPAAKNKPKDKKKEMQGVFVLGIDGYAHFRPVKAGLMGDTKVEILSGLKEGEEVITGPLKSLRVLDDWIQVKKNDFITDEPK